MKWILFTMIFGFGQQIMAQCNSAQWPVAINIVPDSYPEETSWKLFTNNTEVASGLANSDTICVDTSACARFEIYDSYGDGICCGYGNGSYTIFWNGVQIATGGAFQTIVVGLHG